MSDVKVPPVEAAFVAGFLPQNQTTCDDCKELVRRRTKCLRCGKFVCGWCHNHVHGPAMLAECAAKKPTKRRGKGKRE
jgi:formylmethanofuran dehydrogenase subunit E